MFWHSSDRSNSAEFGSGVAVCSHSYDIVNCAAFFLQLWLGLDTALKLYCILSSVPVF